MLIFNPLKKICQKVHKKVKGQNLLHTVIKSQKLPYFQPFLVDYLSTWTFCNFFNRFKINIKFSIFLYTYWFVGKLIWHFEAKSQETAHTVIIINNKFQNFILHPLLVFYVQFCQFCCEGGHPGAPLPLVVPPSFVPAPPAHYVTQYSHIQRRASLLCRVTVTYRYRYRGKINCIG
jgi:hypothetical protein